MSASFRRKRFAGRRAICPDQPGPELRGLSAACSDADDTARRHRDSDRLCNRHRILASQPARLVTLRQWQPARLPLSANYCHWPLFFFAFLGIETLILHAGFELPYRGNVLMMVVASDAVHCRLPVACSSLIVDGAQPCLGFEPRRNHRVAGLRFCRRGRASSGNEYLRAVLGCVAASYAGISSSCLTRLRVDRRCAPRRPPSRSSPEWHSGFLCSPCWRLNRLSSELSA